jgi:hypothetical protein|tara:strand:- start:3970 stop:4638 length:669 start_codon:yes stop_codon:yes gene_type:complete
MFKQQEIFSIIAISLIFAFSINLLGPLENFLYLLLSVFIIILINTFAKKIAAHHMDSEIEMKIWPIERWGLGGVLLKNNHPSKEFKNPLLLGAFLPLLSKIILFPINNFIWMGSLIFDIKTKIYKSAKRHHKLYSFSEITEYQIGLIAAIGIATTLLSSILAYLIGFPPQMDFVRLSIFYAFFNMLPLSNLDGNKIFFGNQTMWYALSIITLVGFGYAFILV